MNDHKPLKVLFISRAYPPIIGGIEKQNHEIATALGGITVIDILANRRGKKFIPIFLVYAFFRTLLSLRKVDVILLGDGVLAILGFLVKCLSNKPVVCILHGLDITFSSVIYQRLWVRTFLPVLDQWIAVGNETIRQGELRGLDRNKFVFIGNGVSMPEENICLQKSDLQAITGIAASGKVILTLGRLVKRKGVEWFVSEVMPHLPNDITYIIAGDGKERENIISAIAAHGLQQRVIFLGMVSDEIKKVLLNTVDIFVQPNIPVAGDMEGFGLVVLEAAVNRRVVIASALEGLQDAIHDGENGILLSPQNASSYREAIERLLSNPQALQDFGIKAAGYVRSHFSWDASAKHYLQILESVTDRREA